VGAIIYALLEDWGISMFSFILYMAERVLCLLTNTPVVLGQTMLLMLLHSFAKKKTSQKQSGKQTGLLRLFIDSWKENYSGISMRWSQKRYFSCLKASTRQLQSGKFRNGSFFCYTEWDFFASTEAYTYANTFLEIVNLAPGKRPAAIEGTDWALVTGEYAGGGAFDGQYWAVYSSALRRQVVATFRGSNGTLEESATHPSSPLKRLFDENAADAAGGFRPFVQLVQALERAGAFAGGEKLVVLGYSMGGLAALMVADHLTKTKATFHEKTVTFNPTLGFVPPSLHRGPGGDHRRSFVMGELEGTAVPGEKVENWLVRDDPLSYGVDLLDWRFGHGFGATYYLPRCTWKLFLNHGAEWFLGPTPGRRATAGGSGSEKGSEKKAA